MEVSELENAKELRELRERIDVRLPIAEQETADRIRKLAEDAGMTLEEVIGKSKSPKRQKRAKRIAKAKAQTYGARWRDGKGNTWSGRGRRPKEWDAATAVRLA